MLTESGGHKHYPAGAVTSSIQPVRLSALSPLAAFFHRSEKFHFESVSPTLSAPPEKKRGMRTAPLALLEMYSPVSVCVCRWDRPWDMYPYFLCWLYCLAAGATCSRLKNMTRCSRRNTRLTGTSSLQAWLCSGEASDSDMIDNRHVSLN